jgi:site-specific DNA-methyltransferase (adenine-specific)
MRHADGAEKANPYAGTSGEVRRNPHPTVKSIALMRWLVRLVTPPGGLVLDPFTGSGSTGAASVLEGFRFLGIEQSDTDEEPYVRIARARIAYWADPEAHAERLAEARRLAVVEEPEAAAPAVEQLGFDMEAA